MKRTHAVLILLSFLLPAASFAQDSLPEVFSRMKAEFGQGDYTKSLADVETLDSLSRRPGFENDRTKLAAPIVFYRAANLASLGRRDEARDEFVKFLALSPNAAITSPPFGKRVVDAFTLAQKAAAGRPNDLAAAYAAYVQPPASKLASDSLWATSPVRYLLSNDEKKAYTAMAPAEREQFVETFWKAYDPTPETAANEFRSEFERRVAFADQHFGTATMQGRETDRALIFAFLGPPSFATLAPLAADNDVISTMRGSAPGYGSMSGRAISLETPDKLGTREAWTYRGERIPPHVPFKEIRFDFITKEGYGDGVLQKDANILQTLGIATDNARKEKRLN